MNRSARHVRRTRLRISPGAPQHHLAFRLEEALRLTELPGENEGRVYYIRRLRISGLPSDGDRAGWLDQFQRALADAAEMALCATDPRAAAADVVYFRSKPEALEILLHRTLASEPLREWYWPLVIGRTEAEPTLVERWSSAGQHDAALTLVAGVIEQFRQIPASWTAIAKTIFSAPRLDSVRLLSALPPYVVEEWLADLVQSEQEMAEVVEREFHHRARHSVIEALRVFSSADPRTLWFATLAMLLDQASDMAAPVAFTQARVALRKLVRADSPRRSEPAATTRLPITKSAQVNLERVEQGSQPVKAFPAECAVTAQAAPDPESPRVDASQPAGALLSESHARVEESVTVVAAASNFIGAPTQAAGLFFLLNVLSRLGMEKALDTQLAVIDPAFPARVLQRLTIFSRIPADDPVCEWLTGQVEPNRAVNVEYLVRLWCLAVRRWCWTADHLKIQEIVSRAGLFSANRTDLDISLPIQNADIRIRRAGLDLDPGWLPWFGRVVRFHYHDLKERRG